MRLSTLLSPAPGNKLVVGRPGGNMRLVLCDDDLLFGEALVPTLTASGHRTAAIATSLTGELAAIRTRRPGACLIGSAWSMPCNSWVRGGVGGSEI